MTLSLNCQTILWPIQHSGHPVRWPLSQMENWPRRNEVTISVSTQLTYPLLITVHPVQHLYIGSEVVILFDDVRSVVLQHDFYAYERHIHSDCLNASLGGNPHLRQSDPVFCRCDALNLPQRCRPTWQLTESLLPPRSGPPLYLLRSKKLQENQMTSFFRLEPEIFCSQQQTKFVHSTRGYPARYSLGVIPVWVLKNLWNDGIDWKLRR